MSHCRSACKWDMSCKLLCKDCSTGNRGHLAACVQGKGGGEERVREGGREGWREERVKEGGREGGEGRGGRGGREEGEGGEGEGRREGGREEGATCSYQCQQGAYHQRGAGRGCYSAASL